MAENHNYHHHKRDSASDFKRHSINSIAFRKKLERVVKVALIILAIVMAIGVVASRYLL